MKNFFLLFSSFFVFAFSFKSTSQEWKIEFSNGDSIHCNSFTYDKDTISLIAPEFENSTLKRKISELYNIKNTSYVLEKSQTLLFFKDSSQIACNIKGIKDNNVIIAETDFAGEIKVPLAKIAEIVFLGEGLNQTISEINWRNRANWQILPAKYTDNFKMIEDKILLLCPVIAMLDCPFKKVKISFSSLFNYDYGLSLLLFSNIKKDSSEGYIFNLTPYSIRLKRFSNNQHNSLGEKQSRLFDAEPIEPYILNYVILADKENGIFEVIINGKERLKFNDSNDKKINGSKIALICSVNFSVFSNLSISEWDGNPLELESIEKKVPFKNNIHGKNVISLQNNDFISGNLLQIANETVKFKTDFGVLDIPVNRVKKIILTNEDTKDKKNEIQKNEGVFEVFIGNNTRFELIPSHCDGKTLYAFSPLLESNIAVNTSFIRNMQSIFYASKITKQSSSLFDEIFKLRPMASIDELDQEIIEEFEKELGNIIEFLYY